MNTRTPADWKALFESDAFAQQNTYTGPLGVEYTPAGTRLRLWAPTARQVYVNLYRRGDGGVCIGSLPLEKRGQGLWSVYLPATSTAATTPIPSTPGAPAGRPPTPTPERRA